MTEPYIKARPSETPGHVIYEVDQTGHEFFERLVKRAVPIRQDDPHTFRQIKERIEGAFMAGSAVMGWRRKK